jgi:hypothetical protein
VVFDNVFGYLGVPMGTDQANQEANTTSVLNNGAPESSSRPAAVEEMSGLIDPASVEHRGYIASDPISARTDSFENLQYAIPLDVEHGWIADEAELSLWDLDKLYVVNGSFPEGYPGANANPSENASYFPLGWDANSTDTVLYADDVQLAAYDSSGTQYVSVESQGGKVGQDRYGHAAGTQIVWLQTVQNTPYTEDFVLDFRYFYLRGPLDMNPSDPIVGNCSIVVIVGGDVVWEMSLLTLSQRGVWTQSGMIRLSIPGVPAAFTFEIGLRIDESLILDKDSDYDNNGIADGIGNAAYITVFLDDVSFIKADPPHPEEVDLSFGVTGVTELVTGSSEPYAASIVNVSFWQTSTVEIVVSANTSVSFTYQTRLLSHRFTNSSWRTDVSSPGVAYSVEPGFGSDLVLYAYVGYLGAYEEPMMAVRFPADWENVTVSDPFLTDLTSSCIFSAGQVEVPSSLMNRLGWWEIRLHSPNYASGCLVERYDSGGETWVEDTVYHGADSARGIASIGHGMQIPEISHPVVFTWYLPNCTSWEEGWVSTGSDGTVVGPSVTLGPANTSAGEWCLTYFWTNGSEIAFGQTGFALHHQATLHSVFGSVISDIVVGQPVTVAITLYDTDNGHFILGEAAEIMGNWSGSQILFSPNVAANWWETDFDTMLVGAGSFNVLVTSTAPYYESSNLTITIISEFLTQLDAPSGPLLPLTYSHEYGFGFFYSLSVNGSGIPGAQVDVTEEGSQWAQVEDYGNGTYHLTVVPLGVRDYSIRLTFSKEGYREKSYVLSFIVQRVQVRVALVHSLIWPEDTPFQIGVQVTESGTGLPVEDAIVTLGVYPEVGASLYVLNMTESSPGIYSVEIVMPEANSGNYEIRVNVEKENYELEEVFVSSLLPAVDPQGQFWDMVIGYSTNIGLLAAVVGAVALGRREYVRRKRARMSLAMEFKRRFDDANNLLGFIVLHKLSGVPIYSKILKGGFEEGMFSAFITAITHFRTEIESSPESEEYAIMPVSDIIRTVATRNLICAFITVASPSKEQEQRMREFARAVGMMMDENLAEPQARVLDARTVKTFEWMFDEFMDGGLVKGYELSEISLPKRLHTVGEVIEHIEVGGIFHLGNLLRALMGSGYGQSEAHLMIRDAVENEYIVPARESENHIVFSQE